MSRQKGRIRTDVRVGAGTRNINWPSPDWFAKQWNPTNYKAYCYSSIKSPVQVPHFGSSGRTFGSYGRTFGSYGRTFGRRLYRGLFHILQPLLQICGGALNYLLDLRRVQSQAVRYGLLKELLCLCHLILVGEFLCPKAPFVVLMLLTIEFRSLAEGFTIVLEASNRFHSRKL